MKQISKSTADMGLLSVTFFWGTTFILSKILLGDIPLSNYLAIRLTLAAVFISFFSVRYRSELSSALIKHGVILGVFLFFSYLFQMWGIQYTTASNAGFITGLSVILVPVFAVLFFKDKPRVSSLVGVMFATAGLYYLSGGDFYQLNKGDWLVFVCALTVTFHVILTGRYAPLHNIYLLTSVQLITTAVLSLAFAAVDRVALPDLTWSTILLLIYLAAFGTVYTFLMQTAMQRYTTATRTALVFTMEPVFAALFAYIIGGEELGILGWFGGSLILIGMIIAEINWMELWQNIKMRNS